jgi:hypothetical protein
MNRIATPYGNLAVTDEYVPRDEWADYMLASKRHAQGIWERDEPESYLTLEQFRALPKREPVRTITSLGYVYE